MRFEEHRTPSRASESDLHKDIQELGYQNFEISELEKVPLEQLDEKEKYWIEKLDTFWNGYNRTKGGQKDYRKYYLKGILIVEKGFKIQSRNYFAEKLSKITSWSQTYISKMLYDAFNRNKTFLGYHIEEFDVTKDDIFVDEDVLDDWIKTLNIRYQKKHIYCFELDKEFESSAEACKYLVDNDLYDGDSKYPLRSLATSINKNLNGKTKYVQSKRGNLTFIFIPGEYTKQDGGKEKAFKRCKIYCPELDKEFSSQIEAAEYFVENKIWGNIKLKTAKLRISDCARGYFDSYKGYTFKIVEE